MEKIKNKLSGLVNSSKYWWVVAGVFSFSRVATWLFPFDSDHWIFYYVGRRWVDGDILYLQVWDHKAPLIFAINGGMHAIFGDNLLLHRLFLTAIAVVSVILFYKTVVLLFKLLPNKLPVINAKVATLLFAFWANLSQFTNSGNNTENFGVLALITAVYCYLKWRSSSLWKWLVYSGLAISILVFLKINFSILLLPLIIDFVYSFRKSIQKLIGYGALWIIPTLLQALVWYSYFAPRKLLPELWTAAVSFNGKYLKVGWAGNLSSQTTFIAILIIAFLFFVGAYYFFFKNFRRQGLLLGIIGLSALLFSIILGTFYSHYYLVVIPYFCIVSGVYWRQIFKKRLWMSLAILGLVFSYGISLKQLYNRFYGSAATEATNMTTAASYVNEHTSSNDKIIFYAYGATFYRLAERDSGSRYISASHPLIDEREGFGYQITDKYIGDMETSKPIYVIFEKATKDLYAQNRRVVRYFENHYQLETKLEGFEIWKRTN